MLTRKHRIYAAGLFYLGVVGVFFGRSLIPAQSQDAVETPKQVYQDRCSACHNAYDPAAQALTLMQWRATVNRMLYRHGASAEITPADTQTILTYLATFAVPETSRQPRRLGAARRIDNSDVWAASPTYSHMYMFGADSALAPTLQAASSGIAWKVLSADNAQQLALRAKDNVAGPDLLLMPTSNTSSGGLRLEAVFSPSPIASAAATPLSFGLAFGDQTVAGEKRYDLVRYVAKRNVVEIIATDGKTTQVLGSKTLDAARTVAFGGGKSRTLRVDVIGSRVKAWLDYNKVLDTVLAQAPTETTMGVWTGSRASVKSLAVDCYPSE